MLLTNNYSINIPHWPFKYSLWYYCVITCLCFFITFVPGRFYPCNLLLLLLLLFIFPVFAKPLFGHLIIFCSVRDSDSFMAEQILKSHCHVWSAQQVVASFMEKNFSSRLIIPPPTLQGLFRLNSTRDLTELAGDSD